MGARRTAGFSAQATGAHEIGRPALDLIGDVSGRNRPIRSPMPQIQQSAKCHFSTQFALAIRVFAQPDRRRRLDRHRPRDSGFSGWVRRNGWLLRPPLMPIEGAGTAQGIARLPESVRGEESRQQRRERVTLTTMTIFLRTRACLYARTLQITRQTRPTGGHSIYHQPQTTRLTGIVKTQKRGAPSMSNNKKTGAVVKAFDPVARLKRTIRGHFTKLGFTKASDGTLVLPGTGKEVVRQLHQGQREEHVGFAAKPVLNPPLHLVLRPHVILTDDGKTPLDDVVMKCRAHAVWRQCQATVKWYNP
jgi:hypothetical protein